MASAIISRFVLASDLPPAGAALCCRVLVLPGSRAHLLAEKLHRDPRLAEAVHATPGWSFLKYRHLRELAARPDVTLARLPALLAEDPLTGEATQMALF